MSRGLWESRNGGGSPPRNGGGGGGGGGGPFFRKDDDDEDISNGVGLLLLEPEKLPSLLKCGGMAPEKLVLRGCLGGLAKRGLLLCPRPR